MLSLNNTTTRSPHCWCQGFKLSPTWTRDVPFSQGPILSTELLRSTAISNCQSRCSVTKPDFKYNSNDWLFVLCTYKVRLVLPCRFAFTHACIACLQRSVTNTDENIAATETICQRGENLNEGLVKACKSLLVTHMPSLYFGIG